MIGHRQVEQAALFYEFSLEKIFPPTTCCGRSIGLPTFKDYAL